MKRRRLGPAARISSGVQERMNKLFESALARTNFEAEGGVGAWTPVSDVYETADALVFCLELPGLAQPDIDVRIEGDELRRARESAARTGSDTGEQFHRVERSYGKLRPAASPCRSHVDRGSVARSYRTASCASRSPSKDDGQQEPIRVAIR